MERRMRWQKGDCPVRRKRFSWIACAVVVLLWTSALIECAQAQTVNVMILSWLTLNGQSLRREEFYASSMIVPIVMRHFNERDPVVIANLPALIGNCNVTLRIIDGIRDTQGLSSVAMSNFVSEMDNQEVHAAIVVRSEVAQTLAITAGALGIPIQSASATAPVLSNKVTYPTFFRTTPSDAQSAAYLAELLSSFGYTTVGLLHGSDAAGTGLRNALTTAFEDRKMRLRSALFSSTSPQNVMEDSIRLALGVFVSDKIQVIIKGTLTLDHEIALAKAARDVNWVKGKLYIGRRFLTRELIQAARADSTLRTFLAGSIAVVVAFNQSGAGYQRLRNFMPTINVSEVNAVLPDLSTNELPADFFQAANSDGITQSAAMYDGIIAMGLAACQARSTDFFDAMKRVNFLGASGRFAFSSTLDRQLSTVFMHVENWLSTDDGGLQSKVVAQTVSGNWTFLDDIIFNDGTTNFPTDVDRPQVQIDGLPLGARIAGWTESAVGLFLSLVTLIAVFRKRGDKFFRLTQPGLSMILLLASMVLASSILPLTFESDAACMAFPWTFILGFTTALVGIGLKSLPFALTTSWRIRACQVVFVSLYLGAIAALIVFQAVEPLTLGTIVLQQDSGGLPLVIASVCTNGSMNSVFAVLSISSILAFFALTMGLCAQRSRGVNGSIGSTQHQEDRVPNGGEESSTSSTKLRQQVLIEEVKHLTVASLCIFQVFFVGLPTAAAVWQITLSRFLVLSSVAFVLCLVILGTIFAPKFVFKLRVLPRDPVPPSRLASHTSQQESSKRNTSFRPSSAQVLRGENLDRSNEEESSNSGGGAARNGGGYHRSGDSSTHPSAPVQPGKKSGNVLSALRAHPPYPRILPSFVTLDQLHALTPPAVPAAGGGPPVNPFDDDDNPDEMRDEDYFDDFVTNESDTNALQLQ